MSTNYKGSIVSKLFAAVENNPDMSMGEILYSFLHKDNLRGQHFFYASDIEIYNSLEKFTKIGVENDEPLTSNEFEFWVEGKNYSTK
jgi:hypothetical protein